MKKFLTILAMAAAVCFVSCVKDDDDDDEQGQEAEKGLAIDIDGDFGDCAALKADVVVSAKNNANSPWDAVKEIRCCADKNFVFYYIKYDNSVLKEQMESGESLPIRLCINTDGEFTTGYASYFLEAYDFIIEGALADGAGAWADYDGTLHQRTYLPEQEKEGWLELLKPGNNLVAGKGAGSEYELRLAREIFNNAVPAGHKMGDVFQTGIRFYGNGGWGELSNMPNSSVEEVENGWGHLLTVTTAK